jgi:CO/xanthine dehydrogenase Mo-binding subunit
MVATTDAPAKMVGQPLKRREDPRLISGLGRFLDDVKLPGMAHAVTRWACQDRVDRHQPG